LRFLSMFLNKFAGFLVETFNKHFLSTACAKPT
jgi:hypothetical protein